LSTLLGNGFYHTMNRYIEGSKSSLNQFHQKNVELQQFQFECAWRLGQWDSCDEDSAADSNKVGSAFGRHRFLAIDNLLGENGNEHEFHRHLKLASREIGFEFSRLKNFDSACSVIQHPLVHLRAIRELEVIAELMPRIGKGHQIDRALSARVNTNLDQVSVIKY